METLTDRELYNRCREYGGRSIHWRDKFIGLLPEVYRRRLYEKKGYASIFEFAAKLGGLSQEHVRRVLNIEKKFEYLPHLREALVTGEVSINKLARVASIATVENEEELMEKVKLLPQATLEVMVRDVKNENGLLKLKSGHESVRTHNLELSPEVTRRLAELQHKGIDLNELLTQFLNERGQKIEIEKAAVECETTDSRYIPASIRKILAAEHGTQCSMPDCKEISEEIHHKIPFALLKNHAPHLLAPLCKAHHQIAHAIHGKVWEKRARVLTSL